MNIALISDLIYTNKRARIAAHVLFWLLLILIKWYITGISFNDYSKFSNDSLFVLSVTSTLNFVLFYYPFVYLVLPMLLYKRKYLQLTLATVALIIMYTWVDAGSEMLILKRCQQCMLLLKESNTGYYQFLQRDLLSRMFGKIASMGILVFLFFSLSIPLSIKLGLRAFRQQVHAMKLAKDNVQLEFNFLKSQLNPHFLFNTLNNIYGLILNDEKEKSARLVARLSEFMRYTLYDLNKDRMPVETEVQLLKDYIELEKIRLNHTRVKFDHHIDVAGHTIASLLFIPIIENAFKHNADIKSSYININFQINKSRLQFSIENTVDTDQQLQSKRGIGLQNFRKRIELYYPGKYKYEVNSSETNYHTKVIIDLA